MNITWLHYGQHPLASLRRSSNGSIWAIIHKPQIAVTRIETAAAMRAVVVGPLQTQLAQRTLESFLEPPCTTCTSTARWTPTGCLDPVTTVRIQVVLDQASSRLQSDATGLHFQRSQVEWLMNPRQRFDLDLERRFERSLEPPFSAVAVSALRFARSLASHNRSLTSINSLVSALRR